MSSKNIFLNSENSQIPLNQESSEDNLNSADFNSNEDKNQFDNEENKPVQVEGIENIYIQLKNDNDINNFIKEKKK